VPPLSRFERAQIALVRASLRPGPVDAAIRLLQRSVGQWWIRAVVGRLLEVHGVDRLPPWDPGGSVVLVSNHRSFFDLYVTTAVLVSRGLPHRILFPVRSAFFYDHPLGPFVNGAMSFFAMYPPIFRERKRASLNLASLDEAAALLRRGGFFVGLHPEGTRKTDDDPYTFLPAQSGVGRVIHKARVPVIPVFVNGLGNDLPRQVAGGLTGSGRPIHMVFGAPIDLRALMQAPGGPRAYRRIAERCIEAIGELGREERAYRG
jgi:1-acyl-sn-glycerol-3-phosphate acyltransferase